YARSASRLTAKASDRAAAIATLTQIKSHSVGKPPAARTMPIYANGSAKIVCSKRTRSRNTRTLCASVPGCNPRASAASSARLVDPILRPLLVDKLLDRVAHFDLDRPAARMPVARVLRRRVNTDVGSR